MADAAAALRYSQRVLRARLTLIEAGLALDARFAGQLPAAPLQRLASGSLDDVLADVAEVLAAVEAATAAQ